MATVCDPQTRWEYVPLLDDRIRSAVPYAHYCTKLEEGVAGID